MCANMDSKQRPIKKQFYSIKPELASGLGFSFFINILMLVSPIFMLQAYDRVLPSRSELTLLMLLLLAIILLVVLGILDSTRHRLMSRAASKLDQPLSGAVLQSVLELNRHQPSPNSTSYLQDVQSIKQFIGGHPICCFFDAPWVPIFILCNYIIHPLLGTITLMASITIFLIAYLNERKTRLPTEKAQQQFAAAQQYAGQGISQLETLDALGMTKQLESNWSQLNSKANVLSNTATSQAGIFQASTKAFRLILQTLILAAGCWLAINQEITAGAMIAASIIMGRALAPVEQAIGSWRIFIKARESFRRIDQLLYAFPASREQFEHQDPEGLLEADKLIIYPPESQKAIIKGVSFKLEPGERLMIAGASGCGKTTLARALAGIWHPRSGSVKLDGIDLRQWSREQLGKNIGYLAQQIEFMPGTVAQNIARFTDYEDHEVIEAAKLAGVYERIIQFEDGFQTQLDPKGSSLSSGQKQLVGLARALFRKPCLLILDEPNAHLDRQGDASFNAMLDRMADHKITTIVISHKDHVLRHVDKFLEIKFGQVAQFGPVKELFKPKTRAMERSL